MIAKVYIYILCAAFVMKAMKIFYFFPLKTAFKTQVQNCSKRSDLSL